MDYHHTILIVDDDPIARSTLEALLFQENYRLVLTASGQEALGRLDEFAPDIILLDVMMPGMNGFQVCQRLKANERWRKIPIILITALGSPRDMVRGFEAGADDFLYKPVNVLELRARVRSMLRLREQYEALEEMLRLREQLSDMIVHDMRDPLASILLLGTLLKESLTMAYDLACVDKLLNATQHLNVFVNDLLLMAKTQEHKLVLNRLLVDVDQLVLAAKENHSEVAQSKKINLVVELPEASQKVSLAHNLFSRVLDNLISNALKFSPAESTVTVRVEYEIAFQLPARVRVTVLDQGPSLAHEYREYIFDKFQVARLREQGIARMGLGLAFCNMVVEAHGGRMSVDANEPQGCAFIVEV